MHRLGSFELAARHLTAPKIRHEPMGARTNTKLVAGRAKLATFCRSHSRKTTPLKEESKEAVSATPSPRRSPRRTPSGGAKSVFKSLRRVTEPVRQFPTVEQPEQLALLVLNQRRARKYEEGNITETDVLTNEPLDVWLRLQGVKQGSLRTRLVYREFETSPHEHSFLAAVYVEVLEAAELAKHKGSRRARSAFVEVDVGRQKYATRTVANANHPRWDEACTFFVADLETPSLRLTVKEAGVDAANSQITRLVHTAARAADYAAGLDKRFSKAVVLGDLVLSLTSDFGDRWLPLQNARSGRVHVSIKPLYLDRRTFPEPSKRSVFNLDDAHHRTSKRAQEWRDTHIDTPNAINTKTRSKTRHNKTRRVITG